MNTVNVTLKSVEQIKSVMIKYGLTTVGRSGTPPDRVITKKRRQEKPSAMVKVVPQHPFEGLDSWRNLDAPIQLDIISARSAYEEIGAHRSPGSREPELDCSTPSNGITGCAKKCDRPVGQDRALFSIT